MHYCLFDFACIVTCTLRYFSRDSGIELRFFPVSLLRKNREIKNPRWQGASKEKCHAYCIHLARFQTLQ